MIRRSFFGLVAVAFGAGVAMAADGGPSAPATGGIWELFRQSRDLFTVLLVLGSLVGCTVAFVCFMEIRESKILPNASISRLAGLLENNRIQDFRDFVLTDGSFVSRSLRGAVVHIGKDRSALREAAELGASEESARWFRRIELLNIIGNLGPLLGLAGTVWGMILAFASLGEAGGQTQAANLSLGISKALFHTLLGLCLAIPCLLVFGIYRSIVDRICTRGMLLTADLVEKLPAQDTKSA